MALFLRLMSKYTSHSARTASSCKCSLTANLRGCQSALPSVVGESVQFLQFRILQRHWHDHRDALSDFGKLDNLHRVWIKVSDYLPNFEVLRECAFKLETLVCDEMAESYDFDSHAI